MEIGSRYWVIAEGYIPAESSSDDRRFVSHEAACILNANDETANIEITIYFKDKEPVGPYKVTVPARRTFHMRFNDLTDPAPIPLATDYSSVFISDLPVVIQHTRLDSRVHAHALLSTIAYAG